MTGDAFRAAHGAVPGPPESARNRRMGQVRWLLARLSRIRAAEVPWRLHSVAMVGMRRMGLFTAAHVPPADPHVAPSVRWMPHLPPGVHDQSSDDDVVASPDAASQDDAAILEGAERLHAGRITLFGRDFALPLDRLDWNRDPASGEPLPTDFGPAIDFRHLGRQLDIKFAWELGRHHDLVTLAQAWALTGDVRHVHLLLRALDRWFEQCPYPRGVHWSSPVEHGIRLINWSAAWQLLGGHDSPLFDTPTSRATRDRWLSAIWQHLHFAATQYSFHSSADNHLIGEITGVFVGALTWPWWPQCARWAQRARSLIERETQRQFLDDGSNFEQAFCYHKFSLEFLLIAGLAGRASGRDFSPAFWARLDRAARCLASLADCRGQLPAIGDADDARVLRLSPASDHRPLQAIAGSIAALTGDGDLAAFASPADASLRWLVPDAARRLDAIATRGTVHWPREFRSGGLVVLGDRLGEPDELRILVDVGPLGANRIAGHGHADALSVLVSVGGTELLVDPGTYCYNADPVARRYFRGTRAHNTACVDDEDQAVWGGSFLWLSDIAPRLRTLRRERRVETLVAEHCGYARLPDPVVHVRRIVVLRPERRIEIHDRFECRAPHRIALHWHFHPDCDVERVAPDTVDEVIVACRASHRLCITPPRTGERALVRGASEPMLGWHSPGFYRRTPTTTFAHRFEIDGTTEVLTLFEIGQAPAPRTDERRRKR